MPKILRIINRFNIGGPILNVAYLTKYMAPEYETILVGGAISEEEESGLFILEQMGIEPIIISELGRELHLINDYKAYQKIRKIIRDFKPDVLHTHASKAGAIGRLAAMKEGVPVIVHTFHGHVFHSYFGFFKTLIYKIIERYLAKHSTKIIAISPIQKKELSEKYKIASSEKIDVISLGFDLDKFTQDMDHKRVLFREKYKIPSQKIVLGIVGRLVPIKNHFLFIDILAELLTKNPQKYMGIIIGDGELRQELIDYAKLKKIDFNYKQEGYSDLVFTSWIKEMDEVYAGLDLVLLTSLNEGTPVSLIEAQVAGKFVISTDVGGVRDVINLKKTGDVVSSFSVHDFIQKIQDYEDVKLSLEEREKLQTRYSFIQLVMDMKRLYKEYLYLPIH
jgi:glycosyltransferase involved in cell wall biosynthesis